MKDRPILMHARSINGILEGRKTQTRRIVKIPAVYESGYGKSLVKLSDVGDGFLLEGWPKQDREFGNFGRCQRIACPYGQPGDRLWVRERFALEYIGPGGQAVFARYADGLSKRQDVMSGREYPVEKQEWLREPDKWKPSIHMPRWASRLTLEVLSIDVQRVQDISRADALAEGVPEFGSEAFKAGLIDDSRPFHEYDNRTTVENFANLWDDTNGAGAWERNDWCWVVDFKRIEQ